MSVHLMERAIIRRCALLIPIYNDPQLFQTMTENWFHVKSWNILKLWRLSQEEYNPLHNYDRHEILHGKRQVGRNAQEDIAENSTQGVKESGSKDSNETIDRDNTFVGKQTGSDSSTSQASKTIDSNTEQVNETTTESDETLELTKSAFNASTYQPLEKQTKHSSDSGNGTTTGTDHSVTVDTGSDEKNTSLDTNNDENENITTKYGDATENSSNTTRDNTINRGRTENENEETGGDNYMYGNIGVTTTQNMFNQEVNLIKNFNIYDFVASLFEDDNFLIVY